jgi:hypothetical protein
MGATEVFLVVSDTDEIIKRAQKLADRQNAGRRR